MHADLGSIVVALQVQVIVITLGGHGRRGQPPVGDVLAGVSDDLGLAEDAAAGLGQGHGHGSARAEKKE